MSDDTKPPCRICFGSGYFPGFSNTVFCSEGCRPPTPAEPDALDALGDFVDKALRSLRGDWVHGEKCPCEACREVFGKGSGP